MNASSERCPSSLGRRPTAWSHSSVARLSTAGLGLMFGSLSLITRDVFIFANAAYYLLLVFCGINIPVSRLPEWAQVISTALPLTRGVQAAREVVSGAELSQVAGLLAG